MEICKIFVKVVLVFVYVGCEFIVIWSTFSIVTVFVESFSQFLSSVAHINITRNLHFAALAMFAVLQFTPSNFLISFLLFIFLRVSLLLLKWHVFLHEELGVVMLGFFCSFCFDYIRSNNVTSDRLLFQEMLLLVSLGILFKGRCRFQYVDDLFLKVFWTIVSGLNARL